MGPSLLGSLPPPSPFPSCISSPRPHLSATKAFHGSLSSRLPPPFLRRPGPPLWALLSFLLGCRAAASRTGPSPPSFALGPNASEEAAHAFTLTSQLDRAGVQYYAVVPSAAAGSLLESLSPADIKGAATGGSGGDLEGTAVACGSNEAPEALVNLTVRVGRSEEDGVYGGPQGPGSCSGSGSSSSGGCLACPALEVRPFMRPRWKDPGAVQHPPLHGSRLVFLPRLLWPSASRSFHLFAGGYRLHSPGGARALRRQRQPESRGNRERDKPSSFSFSVIPIFPRCPSLLVPLFCLLLLFLPVLLLLLLPMLLPSLLPA